MTTPAPDVLVELQRRRADGTLVAWLLNNDGSEPTNDAAANLKLEAVRALLAGTLNTFITNLPATQPVSGTVAVSNFPATQPVSGTVGVGNLPTAYPLPQAQVDALAAQTGLTDGQLRASPVLTKMLVEQAYEQGQQRFGSVQQAIASGGSGHLMIVNPTGSTVLCRVFALVLGSSAPADVTYRRDAALTSPTVVPEFNPNRQFPDDTPVQMQRGTALTGGTVIAMGRLPADVPFSIPLTTDLLPGQSYSISASSPALGSAFTLYATAFFLSLPLA